MNTETKMKKDPELQASDFIFGGWEKELDQIQQIKTTNLQYIDTFLQGYDVKENSPLYTMFLGYLMGLDLLGDILKVLNGES